MKIATALSSFAYKNLIKKIFFLFDPEDVHDLVTLIGRFLGSNALTRLLTKTAFYFEDKILSQTILGINFKNPIGLAAGFDKNAELTDILPAVGFGFEEVGSITGKLCKGNNKPRLWRLQKSQSLLVYYGLKNDGAVAISDKLKNKKFAFPLGVSIAKTNSPNTVCEEDGIEDYKIAYQQFVNKNVGDYYTINISCPNTFGGEPFTDPQKLDRLLTELVKVNSLKPIFIKMPGELEHAQIDQIIEVCRKHKIAGFICTNLAKNRNNKNILDPEVPEHGGMSGKVVQPISDDLVKYIYQKTKGEFIIIGCGGVFNAEDAYKKIKLGANLIQMITGMIFEGPQVVGQINYELAKLLKQDGYQNISEAVGADVK